MSIDPKLLQGLTSAGLHAVPSQAQIDAQREAISWQRTFAITQLAAQVLSVVGSEPRDGESAKVPGIRQQAEELILAYLNGVHFGPLSGE